MSFNVYQHRIKNEILLIVLLFFISVAIRVPIIIIFGDTNLENEWATLFNNLINHGVLAIHNFDGFLLPNLWMPPLYAYYIYIFSFCYSFKSSGSKIFSFLKIILHPVIVFVFIMLFYLTFSGKIN